MIYNCTDIVQYILIMSCTNCEELKKEITDYVKDNLARYKAPKFIEFVDTFPVSPAGKTQRGKLKRQYENYIEEK